MDSWETLGDHLSTLADRRGYTHARDKVFVSDGATHIRSLRERCFPDADFILDWCHATEHLHQDALAGFGPGPAAEAWYERPKDRLWTGRLGRFPAALETLGQPNKPVKTFRCKGGITAAVWQNQVERAGKTSTRFSVTVEKRYRDRNDDTWRTSSSLFAEDLPKVQLVLAKAYEFICLQETEEPESSDPF